MVSEEDIERILGTYALEDIFELNDKTEADILLFLVKAEFIQLPDVRPL